jgi:lipid II:glycine glycyltransferase (peptidoglycan interpeptide bridge formation enzyme)
MECYQIDPMQDARWAEFVGIHPNASVFHSIGWLNTLRSTYGYEPVVFSTSPPNEKLKNGLVFCRVKSWLTGNRLVSLPFSDHCEPLCDSVQELNFLLRHLQTALGNEKMKYMEIRPVSLNFGQAGAGIEFLPAATHSLHILDLRPDWTELFQSFDKDSVQRRIGRADRAGLVEKSGRSDDLLKDFYTLFVTTRSRHSLPPIPYFWFRNLVQCQGEALEIRLAYKDETAIAGILTLKFRKTVYYKYGCSDVQFNRLGATPWLLCKSIASAKSNGAIEFDLGRTEEGNEGLLTFKNHWVSQPRRLLYWKFPGTYSPVSADGWKLRLAKRVFSCLPDRLLTITGNLIYRHIG